MLDVSHRCSGVVAIDQGDTGDTGACISVALLSSHICCHLTDPGLIEQLSFS